MKLDEMCLYKFIGKCPDCVVDTDESHHPNNRDCPRYNPVKLYDIEDKTDNRKFYKP